MTEPVWLTRQVAEAIHERQIDRHGGAWGVRDAGLLESALARPVNAWSYGEEDLCTLAALLAEGVARNHPFADGNKRTALVGAALFLRLNGLRLTAPNAEAAVMTLGLASGELPREGFARWLADRTVPVET